MFIDVNRIGRFDVIVVDLTGWDCEETLLDQVDDLHACEEEFIGRVFQSCKQSRFTLATLKVKGSNSRQRFMKVQSRFVTCSLFFCFVLFVGLVVEQTKFASSRKN